MGTPDQHDARRRLDTNALSGLAHPLRVKLFQNLTHYGPATATQLAERFGESSGSTSYHLRQLERYGFVETDPDRPSGRERWWRRVPVGVLIDTPDRDQDPAGYEAAKLVISEIKRGRRERHQHWLATTDAWPEEWHEAACETATNLTLTAAELAQMSAELNEVVEAWRERYGTRPPVPGATACEAQIITFPLPPLDT